MTNRYNGLKTLATGSQDLINKLDFDGRRNTFSAIYDYNSEQTVAISGVDGSINPNANYNVTDYIRVTEFTWQSFEYCVSNNQAGINFYDKDRNLIAFGYRYDYTNKQGTNYFALFVPENAFYVRTTYLKTNSALVSSYRGVFIEKDQFPYSYDLVIPTRFFLTKSKKHYFYFANMIDAPRSGITTEVGIALAGNRYYDQVEIERTTAGTLNVSVQAAADGVTDLTYIDFITTDPAISTSGKTISKLHIGNSFTDIAEYETELNTLLTAKGATITELGTMGVAGGLHEAYSGGSIANYLDVAGAEAIICTVSGVTNQPSTTFPGDIYQDSNGTQYYCRGNQLVGGNGKIKFTCTTATIPTPTPASGTLTRISGSGDATITYTSFVDAYNNPFWNPTTNQRDWNYYLTTWGYTAPQIVELQFSVNDFAGGGYDGDAVIDDIYTRTKAVIDEIIAAWTGVKIIYTIQPAGVLPQYVLGAREGLMKATHQLAKKFIKEFELKASASAYNNIVFLCPSYLNINPKLGYDIQTIANPNTRYSVDTIDRAQDSTHPRLEGMQELADHMEGLVHYIIGLLP